MLSSGVTGRATLPVPGARGALRAICGSSANPQHDRSLPPVLRNLRYLDEHLTQNNRRYTQALYPFAHPHLQILFTDHLLTRRPSPSPTHQDRAQHEKFPKCRHHHSTGARTAACLEPSSGSPQTQQRVSKGTPDRRYHFAHQSPAFSLLRVAGASGLSASRHTGIARMSLSAPLANARLNAFQLCQKQRCEQKRPGELINRDR